MAACSLHLQKVKNFPPFYVTCLLLVFISSLEGQEVNSLVEASSHGVAMFEEMQNVIARV